MAEEIATEPLMFSRCPSPITLPTPDAQGVKEELRYTAVFGVSSATTKGGVSMPPFPAAEPEPEEPTHPDLLKWRSFVEEQDAKVKPTWDAQRADAVAQLEKDRRLNELTSFTGLPEVGNTQSMIDSFLQMNEDQIKMHVLERELKPVNAENRMTTDEFMKYAAEYNKQTAKILECAYAKKTAPGKPSEWLPNDFKRTGAAMGSSESSSPEKVIFLDTEVPPSSPSTTSSPPTTAAPPSSPASVPPEEGEGDAKAQAEAGAEAKNESGAESGAEGGAKSDAESGVESGAKSGAESGASAGAGVVATDDATSAADELL